MERILIVEDDSFSRELFAAWLGEEGYSVDVSSSGAEALDWIAQRDYRLVVTDLVQNEVSGMEILAAVKQRDAAAEVIIVTGYANVESARLALKSGASDYLIKPVHHEEFKHSVAQCLAQRRLLDENQELKELLRLYQVSRTLANCLELDRLYPLMLDLLTREMGVTRGFGYFCEAGVMTLRQVKGVDEGVAAYLGEVILSKIEQLGQVGMGLLRDILPPEDADSTPGTQEALYIYLQHKSVLQGVIILLNEPGLPFPDGAHRKSLPILQEQCSLALENSARYHVAKDLLYVDELTGLYNYRYLDVVLDRELMRLERYGSNLSVLFIDLDHFKGVNDRHGHLIGSRVLRELGTLIRKSVRHVDAVIRYGGDEYTIVLVETGMEGAAVVAERIRSMVEQHVFAREEGLAIKLTVSLGYACSPEDAKTKAELLELADRAMYRGKASGKNIVFHAVQLNEGTDRE